MIKAILFDADGVLIQPPGYGTQHAFRQAGLDVGLLPPFFAGVFKQCTIGKADLKEVIKPVLDEAGWDKSVDDFLHEWFSYEHVVNEELFDMIAAFQKRGITCYLASDQEQYRKAYIRDEMKCGQRLDGMYISSDFGAEKEDGVEFFAWVYDDVKRQLPDLKKEEVLLIDDSPRSIENAQAFGFETIFYTDNASLQKSLIYERNIQQTRSR